MTPYEIPNAASWLVFTAGIWVAWLFTMIQTKRYSALIFALVVLSFTQATSFLLRQFLFS